MSKLGLSKEATVNYVWITIEINRLSTIELSYESIVVYYKNKYVESKDKYEKTSRLVDSEIFEFIMEELWYIREDILKKIIDETVNQLQLELDMKGWQYQDYLEIYIKMDDFK